MSHDENCICLTTSEGSLAGVNTICATCHKWQRQSSLGTKYSVLIIHPEHEHDARFKRTKTITAKCMSPASPTVPFLTHS